MGKKVVSSSHADQSQVTLQVTFLASMPTLQRTAQGRLRSCLREE